MPRGDKSSYSPKQRRQARDIEESAERRGYGKKRAGEHPLSASMSHPPASAIGVVGHTALGMAKSDSGLVHQFVVPPSASPTMLNRGISGTNTSHRGVSSAGIGGPAKTVVGINGTAIRPAR